MKKGIFILIVAFAFLACSKDDVKSDCEKNNTCKIEFTNGSTSTYSIYVNNVYQFDVSGKTKKTLSSIPAGFMKITVKQKDGYILSPTVKDYETTIKACESKYLVFP